MKPEFGEFITWAFYGIMSGGVMFSINILRHLQLSVEKLNVQIAVVISKSEFHETELRRHDSRIEKLEDKI